MNILRRIETRDHVECYAYEGVAPNGQTIALFFHYRGKNDFAIDRGNDRKVFDTLKSALEFLNAITTPETMRALVI